jgi:predicted Rossmann-fold nucleotide-binding protein
MDEMFEALTLIQTGRMQRIPFILFGPEFWREVINWDALAEAGTINPDDVKLISFVETAEEAVAIIDAWAPPCP